MTIIDHLFFFGLAVAYPVASYFSFRRLMRRIAGGELISPTTIYRSTVIGHWTMFGMAIVIWLATDRSWAALGFGWNVDTGFLIGLALTAAAVAVIMRQYGSLATASEKTRESLLRQLGDLKIMMPRNYNELGRFYGVSATAGIVEETLWRGYMFWYLGHVMPLWAAAIVTSVIFGFGHIYQGIANVPKIILVGGVFAGLYLLTGSLWLPMLLHAVFDAVQGKAVYGLLSSASSNPSSSASSRIRGS
jgi:membrane protease YdiL (CAAX protease family)